MTEQSPNYLPEDARPAALRLAEFVLGWAGAWPTFSNAHKLGMETAAELLRLHTINHDLTTKHDAALLEITNLQIARDRFRQSFQEWIDKSDWVQETATAKELGKHRADVLRERIKALQARVQELEAMLEKANNQAEHFERHWYLRGDEIESLQAQLDAVGAGGVEPLRRAKCLHRIAEPAQQEQKPVAWRGGPAPHFLGRYQYTDIGLQAEAWKKQALQVEPLFAAPQPIPSNPGGLELKSPANIDSPFNACMYQEHCKRWRDSAVRQPLTDIEILDIIPPDCEDLPWGAVKKIARAVEAAIAKTTGAKPL